MALHRAALQVRRRCTIDVAESEQEVVEKTRTRSNIGRVEPSGSVRGCLAVVLGSVHQASRNESQQEIYQSYPSLMHVGVNNDGNIRLHGRILSSGLFADL